MNGRCRRGHDGAIVVTGGTGGLGLGVCRVLQETGRPLVVTWVRRAGAGRARGRPWGPGVDLRARRRDRPGGDGRASPASSTRRGGVWALVHLVGRLPRRRPRGRRSTWMPGSARWTSTCARRRWRCGRSCPRWCGAGAGGWWRSSSRAALRPFAGASAYAASKAALIALVAAASEEVKHDGVTVNCILPSVIDTPANRAAQGDADHSRWVKPEEIGHVIRFLTSPEASAVTGARRPRVRAGVAPRAAVAGAPASAAPPAAARAASNDGAVQQLLVLARASARGRSAVPRSRRVHGLPPRIRAGCNDSVAPLGH